MYAKKTQNSETISNVTLLLTITDLSDLKSHLTSS